jgi:hypothetical protein
MVTDEQVRRLYMLQKREKSIAVASVKSGMSEKTGRKYRNKITGVLGFGIWWKVVTPGDNFPVTPPVFYFGAMKFLDKVT